MPPAPGMTASEGVTAIVTESTIITSTADDDADRKVTDDIFADLEFHDQAFMFSGQDDLLVVGVKEPENAITLGELLKERETEVAKIKLESEVHGTRALQVGPPSKDLIIRLKSSAPSAIEIVEILEDDPKDDTPGDDKHESSHKRRRRHRHRCLLILFLFR